MSMTCPMCSAWTAVKETRTRKADNVVTRRYECANLHRFSTEEKIQLDKCKGYGEAKNPHQKTP